MGLPDISRVTLYVTVYPRAVKLPWIFPEAPLTSNGAPGYIQGNLVCYCISQCLWGKLLWIFNTLRPRQHGRHFTDNTFKRIFLNENVRISLKISLKFVPKGPINNIPSLVQVMAWCKPGDKPLSEPMMVWSLTHICVTRPQWVNHIVEYSQVFQHSQWFHYTFEQSISYIGHWYALFHTMLNWTA